MGIKLGSIDLIQGPDLFDFVQGNLQIIVTSKSFFYKFIEELVVELMPPDGQIYRLSITGGLFIIAGQANFWRLVIGAKGAASQKKKGKKFFHTP